MGFLSELFFDKSELGSKGHVATKWIIRISMMLISAAFVFGQIKMQHLNRLERIEEKTEENIQLTHGINDNLNERFNVIDERIDMVYEDTYKALNNYHNENQKQLEIIIDFDGENKEMLKRILNIRQEQSRSATENILFSPNLNRESDQVKKITIVPQNSDDTLFVIREANKFYLDSIKLMGYEVFEVNESENNKINFKYKK